MNTVGENGEKKGKLFTTHYITWLSILIAIVILLQAFLSNIKIGTTTLNFVLVPIVLGGMVLGVTAGTILGLASAITIIIIGLIGVDPFTNVLLSQSPVGTVLVVVLKGALSGAVSALAYKAISKKNKTVAAFVAAALCPIINTGIFIIGMLLMSNVLINAGFVDNGAGVIYFLFIVCAGVNFIAEFIINIVLAPSIKRVSEAVVNVRRED